MGIGEGSRGKWEMVEVPLVVWVIHDDKNRLPTTTGSRYQLYRVL